MWPVLLVTFPCAWYSVYRNTTSSLYCGKYTNGNSIITQFPLDQKQNRSRVLREIPTSSGENSLRIEQRQTQKIMKIRPQRMDQWHLMSFFFFNELIWASRALTDRTRIQTGKWVERAGGTEPGHIAYAVTSPAGWTDISTGGKTGAARRDILDGREFIEAFAEGSMEGCVEVGSGFQTHLLLSMRNVLL